MRAGFLFPMPIPTPSYPPPEGDAADGTPAAEGDAGGAPADAAPGGTPPAGGGDVGGSGQQLGSDGQGGLERDLGGDEFGADQQQQQESGAS